MSGPDQCVTIVAGSSTASDVLEMPDFTDNMRVLPVMSTVSVFFDHILHTRINTIEEASYQACWQLQPFLQE